MTWLARLRERRGVASGAVVTMSAMTLGVLAFLDDGVPSTDVELHDGGVWLTNESVLMVGHLNHQSRTLDGSYRTTTGQFDVAQSGNTIVVHDTANSTVALVDPAALTAPSLAALPAYAEFGLGGDTAAILDPTDGRLWVVPVSRLSSLDIKATEPVAEIGGGAALAVGPDGLVVAVSAETGEIVTASLAGPLADTDQREALDLPDDAEVTVTLVGDRIVVLDASSSMLWLGDKSVSVPEGSVLQQPSAAGEAVALAFDKGWWIQPLDGAEAVVQELPSTGTPAAPVSLQGCVYLAWAGAGEFRRDCTEDSYDVETKIDGALPSARFVFRVNRDVVVLNDSVNGTGWLSSDGMERVDNWDSLLPPPDDDQDFEEFEEEDELSSLPERSEDNTPPVAEDDRYGARAGRTTVLPVVDNDYDLDGDLLTAVVVDSTGVPGQVQAIRDGEAFQVVLPPEATGTATFTYRISDGRGGVDDATVTVSVAGEGENTAPEPQRRSRLVVESGATVSYHVLPDWVDPEGDTIFLRSAIAPAPHRVEFTPDGRLTITADPDVTGQFDIDVVVSDGIEDATGTVSVDVWPSQTLPPQTHSDHVVTSIGRPVLVSPLGNDMSRSGEPLRLAKLEEVLGVSMVPDYLKNTFTFSSETAGTYYIQYLATDGATTAPGLVRVDVLPEVDATLPPIAVSDVALVAPGEDTLVDVLANDSDPGGRVLVIQNVEVPERSGLRVAVLEHRLVRVTDLAGLSEPVTLTYLVSNGTDTARADITVLPITPKDKSLPPVAEDDEVVVRAGDVATIDVLDNDTHPGGDELTLVGLGEPLVDSNVAQVFVSDNVIRVRAGDQAGTATALYDVGDEHEQRDSAQLKITIVGADEGNSAPRPSDAVARVLAGNTVRIPITLDGIDPDGDSVLLEGLATSPELGRVVQQGEDWIVYEAYADSQGTDTFEYEVRDRLGASARGSVVVGVAPVRGFNNAPVAIRDEASTRAGHSVSVAVLENDTDPDSDVVTLSSEVEAPEGVEAEVRGDRIVVSAQAEGQYTLQYTITDVFGAASTGTILLTVDDALDPVPPIARDDRIAAADVAEDGTVAVEVLANDEDPDGVVSALSLTVSDETAVMGELGVVTLQVTDVPRIVTYTITDADGLSASAFIMVPGYGTARPQLISAAPIEVVSGETKTIRLADYIITANGNPALVTRVEAVRAAHANGDDLVVDEATLQYTSADGYWGKDAITVEVTDGLAVDDPAGRVAAITIPITVLPAGNEPPAFRDARVEVTPGEDPTLLDLSLLGSDPNEDDQLTYDIAGDVADGFTARIEGTTLSVSADADTPKGTLTDLEIEVSDGVAPPVAGLVRVAVTSASRALAVANDDYVDDARPGKQIVVDVTANDYNPFPAEPLTVVSYGVEAGTGEVLIGEDGLRITPGATFNGTLQVRYTIQDRTGDTDRQVEGRVYVTVVKEPDAPVKPAIRSVEDRTVVLEWTAPANNGAAISHYTVRSDQGTEKRCTTTICTIDGLSNDVEYRFTVTATNRAGESAPSSPSDVARPDIRPEQPAAPSLTFGDRELSVQWTPPPTAGSAITHYTLEISPPPVAGPSQALQVTGTSYVWTGLENGVAYQVRVQARNSAPEPSAWSDYSATEVPAGPPVAPAKPATQRLAPVGNRAQIAVQWAEPSGNGDTVSSYTVTALRGGAAVATAEVPAGVYSRAFELATDDVAYTFSVVAHNKAGASDPSVQSDPRRAFVAPGAPTSVTATPGDGRITVAFSPGPRNGADASWISYEYELNGAGGYKPLPSNRIIGSLSNGSSYTVKIRATATADGVSYTGNPSAASAAAVPYGVPPAPSVSSANSGGTVRFTWSAATSNGRPITTLQYRIDGGSWQSGSTSGGSVNAPSVGGTHSIEVRVQDSEGQWSATASTSRTINPELTLSKGPTATGYCAVASDCSFFHWELRYFPPNYRFEYQCLNSTGAFSQGTIPSSYATNSSGSSSFNYCYSGPAANNTWDTPYYTRVKMPDGTWVRSNDSGW
ncbi:Ig-like domain-containing protein [Demequina sp. TTPB684]|uniref:Ig-like domain-containing protein n=1 Tax=unclassified Demequina TaxID=2620311 RepID=UPI001CF1C326|nr:MULTISPECIES: Ig-like domain-containing protein [unclassified Demequina]MCB2413183.1 Ig-like domain-containing protein [Demequina sp. TTPB684]UPU88358.1 Ig-like domain-containing protein [Demequina sp. TMPB413]